jgi:hypothetical protein
MRTDVRMAHQTNERSAHQPRTAKKHQCGSGCSHNSSPAQPTLKQASGCWGIDMVNAGRDFKR